MKVLMQTRFRVGAGGRLASSAQPPRATSFLTHRLSPQPTPQPTSSASFLDIPGALLKGLRCRTAFRPLPDQTVFLGKTVWLPTP
jgi:hypothetical protein